MNTFPELMARAVEGVFAIDGEQRVIFWNQSCEKLTGISASAAVGDTCHDVLRGRDTHGRPLCRANCPLCEIAKGGPPPAQMPMRITHADGNPMQLSVGTMLIPSPSRNQWNVVHVMRPGRERVARAGHPGHEPNIHGAGMSRPVIAEAGPQPLEAALLTGREREILRLLAAGLDVSPMSDQLHISVTTVRNHIQRLMAKLDVHSRAQAVAYAHRNRLI